jgi:hypothetical protein
MSISWWDEMGRKGHPPPQPPPAPTDWWSLLPGGEKREWFEARAAGLPEQAFRTMLRRTFETEADALAFVERSRRARRRSPEERQGSAERAAQTRKRKAQERRAADRAASVRLSCRIWDDQHESDAEIRAGQSNELKRWTRDSTWQAVQAKELKADWHFGLRGLRVTCDRCRQDRVKIERHHGEYSDPRAVLWLCPYCHGAVHFDEQPAAYWAQTTGTRIVSAAVVEKVRGRELSTLSPAERDRLARWAGREVAIRARETSVTDAAARIATAMQLLLNARAARSGPAPQPRGSPDDGAL